MKTKIALITLSMILSFAAISGSKAPRAERGERLYNQLNLSESQQKQFKETMQRKREKLKAARAQINAETKAELESFLDADQMEKLEKRRDKKMKKMQHKKEHKKKRRSKGSHYDNN